MTKTKGQHIVPLDESEYTSFEINEFQSGDGFIETSDDSTSFEENPPNSLTPIKVFSFETSGETKRNNMENNLDLPQIITQNNNFSVDKDNLNSKRPGNIGSFPMQPKVRGLTPAVDGESFDIKRCYQFRASTIKKLNQLKGESDNINIYLNEIIDAAICFYYNAAFNKK